MRTSTILLALLLITPVASSSHQGRRTKPTDGTAREATAKKSPAQKQSRGKKNSGKSGAGKQGAGRGATDDGTSPAPSSIDEEAARKIRAEELREDRVAARKLAISYFPIADYDANEWISFREAQLSLGVERERFGVYDKDTDGRITLEEWVAVSLESHKKFGTFKPPVPNPRDPEALALSEALAAGLLEGEAPVEEFVPLEADSVMELFGAVTPRIVLENSAPAPDQIVGPIFSFRRLDFDADGGISRDDLGILLLGSGLDMRPNALLASLDTDGDGTISSVEFHDSMRSDLR